MGGLKTSVLTFLLCMGLAGCASPSVAGQETLPVPTPSISRLLPTPAPSATRTDVSPFDYTDLLGALRASGAKVEPAGDVTIPFFSVKGHLIRVNGNDVQVFEFDDPNTAAAQLVALQSAATSQAEGTRTPSPEPHIYKKGRIIVVYVGNDKNVQSMLGSIMGNQINAS